MLESKFNIPVIFFIKRFFIYQQKKDLEYFQIFYFLPIYYLLLDKSFLCSFHIFTKIILFFSIQNASHDITITILKFQSHSLFLYLHLVEIQRNPFLSRNLPTVHNLLNNNLSYEFSHAASLAPATSYLALSFNRFEPASKFSFFAGEIRINNMAGGAGSSS